MNLYERMNNKEITLLKNVGIDIENKNYSNDDLKQFERQIVEYIMSTSSKNGDIDRLRNQYDSIFRTINVK